VGTPGGGNFLARALEFGEEVARLAAREGPYDVAHYRSLWGGLPLLLGGWARRTVFEANSLSSLELPFHYPALRGTPTLERIRRWEIQVLRESDAVVCVSRVTRDFLSSLGAAAQHIEVIRNGVDPRAFRATPLPTRAGRTPVALYVGTLADWQGLLTLVEAMPKVLARRPLRLRIVGRGRSRQRKEIAKRVEKLGLAAHVEVTPGVPHHEVPALVAQADLCIAPLAYNERNVVQGCCPLKVIEYMAAGRPIVASNLPVVRELVREGRDALLVPPDVPEALAEAILRILGDERLARRLADHAARRARARLTWKRAQKRLLKLYARLLEAPDEARDSGPPRPLE
jgi:glycosyltransferase involved in cell wall biosynthesis